MDLEIDKEDILGKGGYGVVFAGTYNGHPVAIKRVPLTDDPTELREEEALQKLNHPNVIKLYCITTNDNFRFFVLERCKASLRDLFEKPENYKGQIKLPFNHSVMLQLAKGLEYIHSQKIVHRDIKPENVLLSAADAAGGNREVTMKWTDFGLCKTVNERETFSLSGLKGTWHWFAPELLADDKEAATSNRDQVNQRGTIKSDVFVEGCLFGYLLLDGQHPFGSDDELNEIQTNIINGNFVNFKQLQCRGMPYAALMINRMLTKNPRDRTTSSHVVQSLEVVKFMSKVQDRESVLTRLCKQYNQHPALAEMEYFIKEITDVCFNESEGEIRIEPLLFLCQRYSHENLIDIVRALIERNVDVNCVNEDGWNALLYLCLNYSHENLIDIVRALIEKNVDVNHTADGWNALLFLCRYYSHKNLVDVVQILIDKGIDVNYSNGDGWNALLFLCRYYRHDNLLEILQILIRQNVSVICSVADGWNALLFLCRYYSHENLEDIVKMLIENGVDVNFKTQGGRWNAMHALCKSYSHRNLIEIVQILISEGIDIDCTTSDGWNAFLLLSINYSNDNLLQIMEIFVGRNVNINYRKKGWNALLLLLAHNTNRNLVDIVRFLVKNEINVHCKSNDGWNALLLLCRHYSHDNLLEIAQIFINNEINLNYRNDSWSALISLSRYYPHSNLIDIIRILTDNNIDVNCRCDNGWNALPVLCQYYKHENLVEIVQILINNNIDVNSEG